MQQLCFSPSSLARLSQLLLQRPRRTLEAARRAAVAVPLLNVSGEAALLFTKRSSKLNSHSGQVSFPGGRQDKEDGGDATRTALREFSEECGPRKQPLPVIGLHDDCFSKDMDAVTPVLVWLGEYESEQQILDSLILSTVEVERAFVLTIAQLNDEKFVSTEKLMRGVTAKRYSQKPDAVIWGLTAIMLERMLIDMNSVLKK